MIALLAAAQPPDPSISGFVTQYISEFFNYANGASESLSAHLISHEALAILAACVIIRILYVAIPALLDNDLSSLAADATSLVVTVFIILTLFAVWNGTGQSQVGHSVDSGFAAINIRCDSKKALTELTNDVASAIPSAAKTSDTTLVVPPYSCGTKGGGVASAVGMAGKAFGKVAVSMGTAATKLFTVDINNGGGVLTKAILDGLGKLEVIAVVFPIMIIAMAVLVVVFVVLLIDIIMAWAHIIIPLTFGPAVIAFYPINPQWTRNVVSSIAGGLISYATTLFVMLIVVAVFIGAADSVTTTMEQIGREQGMHFFGFAESALGQIVPLAFIGALFAYAGNGFVSAAMALVSGSDHFSRHRGQAQGSITGGAKSAGKRFLTGGLTK